MDYACYPVDWPILTREIKEANSYICQGCQRQCRRPGELNLGWEYVLTVAHVTQAYEGEVVQLAALCVRCHLALDSPFVWWARRRHDRMRRHFAGQLEIF